MCHAGLVELIRGLFLRFRDHGSVDIPVAAIWAGQHKVGGRIYTSTQVIALAEDIGYPDPVYLADLYGKINPDVTLAGLEVRANKLDEIARLVSECVRLSFEQHKRLQFHKINQDALGILRKPLQDIEEKSPAALQIHMNESLSSALDMIDQEARNCRSVICSLPSEWMDTSEIGVKIIASALGECMRRVRM